MVVGVASDHVPQPAPSLGQCRASCHQATFHHSHAPTPTPFTPIVQLPHHTRSRGLGFWNAEIRSVMCSQEPARPIRSELVLRASAIDFSAKLGVVAPTSRCINHRLPRMMRRSLPPQFLRTRPRDSPPLGWMGCAESKDADYSMWARVTRRERTVSEKDLASNNDCKL